MRRVLVVGAAALAVAAAGSGAPAVAAVTGCGRVSDTHYSFRVIAHGEQAPSCRTARRLARGAVGSRIDRPLHVPRWSCTADYYYDGPWSFLCIRERTYGQVSIDRFHHLPGRVSGCGARLAAAYRDIARAVRRLLATATLAA